MKTISRKLKEIELPPRAFRHGKRIVMLSDYRKGGIPLDADEGIRKSNTLKVANGPTIMRGLINGGSADGSLASEPNWWKEEK